MIPSTDIERCLNHPTQKDRMEAAERRGAFCRNKVSSFLWARVVAAFGNAENQQARRPFVDLGDAVDLVGRCQREVCRTYSRPPRRSGTVGALGLAQALRLDETMAAVERETWLHGGCLVRILRGADGAAEKLEVIDPSRAAIMADPERADVVRAFIIERNRPAWAVLDHDAPRCDLYTADGLVHALDIKFNVVSTTPTVGDAWPIVLVTARPTSNVEGFGSECAVDSLVAAHESSALQLVFAIKESRSHTKQVYFTGDTSNITRGQASDSDKPILLGEGVSAVQGEIGDPGFARFLDASDRLAELGAAGHGISGATLRNASVTSGWELELRRVGIREERLKLRDVLRSAEVAILRNALLGDPDGLLEGWHTDYFEPDGETLTVREQLETFETRRRLFLASTIDQIQREDPDLSLEDAANRLSEVVRAETGRVLLTRQLQELNGSISAPPDAPTAAMNGGNGAMQRKANANGRQ